VQIRINLLPDGPRKGRAAAGASFSLGATVRRLGDTIRDPWLLGAATAVIASGAAVGLLFVTQQADATQVERRLENAVRDSTRLVTVLEARRQVTAERDSVMRQVRIIRTIDDNRYVWAHLLDEISSALPRYTWLVSVEQTSKPTLPPGVEPPAAAANGRGAAATRPDGRTAPNAAGKAAATAAVPQDSIVIHPPITFRVIGQTVDMQALTQFMKDLEASPFVQHVMLMKSEIVVVETKDITQFQIEAEFEVPPAALLNMDALVVPVR
jgi:hypothetical protein